MRAQIQFQFDQFPEHLAHILINLFSTKTLCDVHLIGEDDIPVEAHKIILAAFSGVLNRIVRKENGNSSEIQLHGMNHHDIEKIVQFMYLGEASVAHAGVDKFLRTAKFLGISQLSDQCKTGVEDLNAEFCIGKVINESEDDDDEIRINGDFGEIVREFDDAKRTGIGDTEDGDRIISNESFEEMNQDEYIQYEDSGISNALTVQEIFLEELRNDQMAPTVKTRNRKYIKKEREEVPHFKLDDEDINKVTFGKSVDDFNEVDAILEDNFMIGEPTTLNFNITESVCFSHNYFRKLGSGIKALCLMCLRTKEKKRVFLSISNNSAQGLLNHLMSKHSEYTEQFSLQRAVVQGLRNERRKRKEHRDNRHVLQKQGEKSNQSMLEENFEVDAILEDNFMIGKPTTLKFNITESVCFSHNYFSKLGSGIIALCLMCLRSKEKKRVFLSFPSNSSKGLIIHLRSQHSEYAEQFSLQRASVQGLRIERRKTNELLKAQRKKNKLKVKSGSQFGRKWTGTIGVCTSRATSLQP